VLTAGAGLRFLLASIAVGFLWLTVAWALT
jgi:hypothetical protein